MNLKLCFNGIEIGLIKDENNSIYLENVNLDNFTMIHKSDVNVEDDPNYCTDSFSYYYRENIRGQKLYFEIYKSNKLINCYLIKTQNYFNIYHFNINYVLNSKKLYKALINQIFESASSELQKRIWKESEEQYEMELQINRELEQKRDELFQNYYYFVDEIAYSIDKSFDLYSNFHCQKH